MTCYPTLYAINDFVSIFFTVNTSIVHYESKYFIPCPISVLIFFLCLLPWPFINIFHSLFLSGYSPCFFILPLVSSWKPHSPTLNWDDWSQICFATHVWHSLWNFFPASFNALLYFVLSHSCTLTLFIPSSHPLPYFSIPSSPYQCIPFRLFSLILSSNCPSLLPMFPMMPSLSKLISWVVVIYVFQHRLYMTNVHLNDISVNFTCCYSWLFLFQKVVEISQENLTRRFQTVWLIRLAMEKGKI